VADSEKRNGLLRKCSILTRHRNRVDQRWFYHRRWSEATESFVAPACKQEGTRIMAEKRFAERTSIFDYAIVPWLLAGAMLATGFVAACFIVLPLA
jgi:hypothetical protein